MPPTVPAAAHAAGREDPRRGATPPRVNGVRPGVRTPGAAMPLPGHHPPRPPPARRPLNPCRAPLPLRSVGQAPPEPLAGHATRRGKTVPRGGSRSQRRPLASVLSALRATALKQKPWPGSAAAPRDCRRAVPRRRRPVPALGRDRRLRGAGHESLGEWKSEGGLYAKAGHLSRRESPATARRPARGTPPRAAHRGASARAAVGGLDRPEGFCQKPAPGGATRPRGPGNLGAGNA